MPGTRRPPAARLLVAAVAVLFAAGCGGKRTAKEPDALPPSKLQALMQADRTISEGQAQKEEGMRLRAEGKGGDDLIKQGEEKITRGEQAKDKAMTLKN